MLSGGAPTLTGKLLFLCGKISAHKFECEANNSGHMRVGHVWIKWVGQLWLSELLFFGNMLKNKTSEGSLSDHHGQCFLFL